MKRIVLLICVIGVLTFQCCKPDFKTDKKGYKICEFRSDDIRLNIYNDVLNELTTHHLYNGYLGEVADLLYDEYIRKRESPDTTKYSAEKVRLHNKIFNDTTRFQTIAYTHCLYSGPWSYYLNRYKTYDSLPAIYANLIKTVSGERNWKAAADTLTKAQTDYSILDFHSCILKVIEGEHFYDADAGVISFSEIVFDESKTKAVLYYEFMCGGKCGMGELLVVEWIDDRWQIKSIEQIWIS